MTLRDVRFRLPGRVTLQTLAKRARVSVSTAWQAERGFAGLRAENEVGLARAYGLSLKRFRAIREATQAKAAQEIGAA